ncbi:MAG: hypothetical protein WDO73_22640 [Ignavibacteriota bacterium]
MAEEYIPNLEQRALARELVHRVSTSGLGRSGGARFRRASRIAAPAAQPAKRARFVVIGIVSSQNTILLGSLRSNPWVSLFEDQMNFQTDYHEKPPAVRS